MLSSCKHNQNPAKNSLPLLFSSLFISVCPFVCLFLHLFSLASIKNLAFFKTLAYIRLVYSTTQNFHPNFTGSLISHCIMQTFVMFCSGIFHISYIHPVLSCSRQLSLQSAGMLFPVSVWTEEGMDGDKPHRCPSRGPRVQINVSYWLWHSPIKHWAPNHVTLSSQPIEIAQPNTLSKRGTKKVLRREATYQSSPTAESMVLCFSFLYRTTWNSIESPHKVRVLCQLWASPGTRHPSQEPLRKLRSFRVHITNVHQRELFWCIKGIMFWKCLKMPDRFCYVLDTFIYVMYSALWSPLVCRHSKYVVSFGLSHLNNFTAPEWSGAIFQNQIIQGPRLKGFSAESLR